MRYRLIVLILGPFMLWSIYFITLYGLQAIGCRANWDTALVAGIPMLRLLLVAVLTASATLSAAMYVLAGRLAADQLAIAKIGRYCTAAGLFSTIIIFPGVFWLELC